MALLTISPVKAAVHFGLPSAVKSTVKKLGAKVQAKKANYTLGPNSVVLSQQTNSFLVNADTATQTYYYSSQAAEIATLIPGKIIISTQGNGFLRKVDSVISNGSQYEVKTTTATMEEAFEEVDIAFAKQLLPQDVSPQSSFQAKGVSFRPSAVSGEWEIQIASAVLYDKDGDHATKDDQIYAVGTIKFTAEVDGVLKIKGFQLQELKMQGTINDTSGFKVKWESSVGLSLPAELESVKLAEYTLPPMAIGPIVVVPVISVLVGVKGEISVSCSAEAGMYGSVNYTAGVWYKNGAWTPINEFSSEYILNTPNFSYDVSANVKAYAGPQLDLMFYNFVGPSISVDGYFAASAQGVVSPPSINWSVYAGLEGVGGGEMDIFSLFKSSYKINLFDYQILLASGTIQPAPTAPDALSAVAASSSQINLAWQDNSDNEDGFKLERKTGAEGAYSQIATLNANEIGYSNTGLSNGTTYYYRLKAYNTGGDSAYSNEASTTTLNNPPVIISFTANPASISTGAVTTITCAASDPDGDTLIYSWSAASGTISGSGTQIIWTAPASSGTYVISSRVSDGKGGSVQSGAIVVVTAAANQAPVIASLTANPMSISTGAVTTITCVASDADGDTLAYNWSAASGVISGSGSPITWTAPDNAGSYSITCAVSDGKGGSVESSVTIFVDTIVWSSASSGGDHTLAVKTDGTLWAWGRNDFGQLGLGDTTNRNLPTQVGAATNWVSVSGGGYHTLAIKTDGTLWAWGYNGLGELGMGDYTSRNMPTQVGTAANWSSVSSGGNHTLAVKTDGTLWAWGYNGEGLLGVGDTIGRNTPTQVGTAANWSSVSSGGNHTLAVKTDGTLWAWGYNGWGQLGVGDYTNRNTPTQVGTTANWYSVSSGYAHTLAVTMDGTLWAWGYNVQGQLGMGDTTSRNTPTQVGNAANWSSVSSGGNHTLAVKTDGTLWAWGENGDGQLGDYTADIHTPMQIGSDNNWFSISNGGAHTLAIKETGTLWAWGANNHGQLGLGYVTGNTPTQVGINNWSSVSGGTNYTLAVTDGTLWAWGNNWRGQLGVGNNLDRNMQIQVGTAANWFSISGGGPHTLAVKTDGTLWAWGYNGSGQLGMGDYTDRNTPTQVGTASNWSSVSGGAEHTFAVKTDGTLWAWGNNGVGQLGMGDYTDRNTPTQVGTASNWSSVSGSGGGIHTLAIKTDGTLWAWGNNGNGVLGLGDYTARITPTQVGAATNWVSVSGGDDSHTLAVKTDGTLWAWGRNDFGQLGLGDTTNRNLPTQVGAATNWVSVSGGGYHTLAVKTDGTLWAWGRNDFGQLGLGDTTDRIIPVQVGTAVSWFSVYGGFYHSLAVKTDGSLWAWGNNDQGQLGFGPTIPMQIP